MTLSLYSTYRAWKRENAREAARNIARHRGTPAAARPHGAMQREAADIYAAIAAMGCGLGGMACGDGMDSRSD